MGEAGGDADADEAQCHAALPDVEKDGREHGYEFKDGFNFCNESQAGPWPAA